jgi:Tfp pilus assembly protein PilF
VIPRLLTILLTITLAACGGAEGRRDAHMQRGQEHLQAGRLEKARLEFKNAVQVDPRFPPARLALARVQEDLGDPQAAAGQYRAALDLEPGQPQARLRLARLYVLGGVPEEAL